MSDKNKMSVEDILAACRAQDGGEAAQPPAASDVPAEPAGAAEDATQAAPADAPAPAAPAKKPGEMSVADILAAARTQDGGEAAAGTGKAAPAADKPAAAAKATPAKKPGEMSVADIMAAARAQDGGAAAKPKPAAAKAAAAKAAPASKASPKAPAAKPKGPALPRDTSSILAAARKPVKPGPISKAEAAAKATAAPAKKDVAKPAKAAVPPMPPRPEYAKPKAKVADERDRRGFFSVLLGSFLAVGFTTLGLTNLLWVLGLARYMFPNILIEPPSKFKVGFPGDFAPDTVEAKYKAQFGVWVVNTEYEGERQIVALKSVCTHLGCTPNWLEAEQKFKCPCHGSGFYKDGVNFEGPAPRPLERYAIRLADDGQLEIDKSKTFQQEMGQWGDPASFVPV